MHNGSIMLSPYGLTRRAIAQGLSGKSSHTCGNLLHGVPKWRSYPEAQGWGPNPDTEISGACWSCHVARLPLLFSQRLELDRVGILHVHLSILLWPLSKVIHVGTESSSNRPIAALKKQAFYIFTYVLWPWPLSEVIQADISEKFIHLAMTLPRLKSLGFNVA